MRSVVLHKGVYNNNLHYHFVAYHPYYSAISLSQTLQEVWERKVVESDNRGRFEPVDNTEAVVRYMTHEWGFLEKDTFSVLELNLTNNNIWGRTNSASNMDDIRKRRLKIHSITDSR
jgi:DNA repair protein RadC